MSMHDHAEHHGYTEQKEQPRGSLFTSRAGLVLLGFGAIAVALLFTEHRAHVLGVLIYLPILLCPLMHFFMHGKHGHGSHGQHESERRES